MGILGTTSYRSTHLSPARPLLSLILAIGAVLALGGCEGDKKKAATQVAAKVNKEEISVHQVNFVLQRQAGLRQDQAEAAGKAVLERLIDQEVVVQKAEEQKLDRDPAILQMLEAAKREVLARAYQERLAESVQKPTEQEIKAYFDSKPALFKERRVYQLQELAVDVPVDKSEAVRQKLQQAKSIADVTDYLKANQIKYTANEAVRAAEQLPMNAVDALSKMSDGQIIVSPRPNGLQILVLAGSRQQPVSLEQAKPAIEQFLVNNRKREVVEQAVKDLRAAAKIEYVGSFARDGAASAAAAEAGGASAAPAAASAASAAMLPPAAASAASNDAIITKGMGLK